MDATLDDRLVHLSIRYGDVAQPEVGHLARELSGDMRHGRLVSVTLDAGHGVSEDAMMRERRALGLPILSFIHPAPPYMPQLGVFVPFGDDFLNTLTLAVEAVERLAETSAPLPGYSVTPERLGIKEAHSILKEVLENGAIRAGRQGYSHYPRRF